MKIKELVAKNLKSLTYSVGNASFVSRQMGINPMQYGRYLSGQQMPNDATMARICNYFGVAELDLVKENNTPPVDAMGDLLSLLNQAENADFMSRYVDTKTANIDVGRYYVYFRVHQEADLVVRSAMTVEKENDVLTFRRFSVFAERNHRKFRNIKGEHFGVITTANGTLYFAAIDSRGINAPSLLAARWSMTDDGILAGLGVLQGPNGPITVDVAIHRVKEKTSFKQFLSGSHVVDLENGEIPNGIRDNLAE